MANSIDDIRNNTRQTTLFLADEPYVTIEQIAAVVREQLQITEYGQTDALRTAIMYLPISMKPYDWVRGAWLAAGIKEGTARNRLSEVRRFQKENGEIN